MKGMGAAIKVVIALVVGLTIILGIYTAVDQAISQGGNQLNKSGENISGCVNDSFDSPKEYNGSAIFNDSDGLAGGC
jgi:hypothetical protein